MPNPASTPDPPYYAVIFTSVRTPANPAGYEAMAARMVELARQQPGFLGVESARGADGLGITVSYWASEEAIGRWREHAEHVVAQTLGRREWYASYQIRVARVERRDACESQGQIHLAVKSHSRSRHRWRLKSTRGSLHETCCTLLRCKWQNDSM